jgi:D-alanyl-D-alanine carboxypeptidase
MASRKTRPISPTSWLDKRRQRAGGGLVSTSRDLAHWGAADYLPELLQSVPTDPKLNTVRYGTGVAIQKSRRFGPVYGHAGWIPGYVSSFRYYRESGVTIAFQINTDKGVLGSGKDILGDIQERIMQVLVGNTSLVNPGQPAARLVPGFLRD